MIRTPRLGPRNRLTEIILTALHDPSARHALERLGASSDAANAADPVWLREASAEDVVTVRARAQRASETLSTCPTLPAEPTRDEALMAAAALFDAGLGFEVHELLEPFWTRAEGRERQALQGLIQIAVGYQHLANGNVAGARALLLEGGVRVREGHLAGLDLDRFGDAVAATVARVAGLSAAEIPRFPRREVQRKVSRPA